MGEARFIAGDWGTSHLRLFLCDGAGHALDHRDGPGAAEATGRFATVFASRTSDWESEHGNLPAVLCGMVGSSFGWVQAPYVPCPARPERIAAACTVIEGRIHVVPGLSCQNRFGAPDVLRGEETQLLGAMDRPGPRQLVCLPGTHTKWVVMEDGEVQDFFTAPTGELFAVLREHSVLVRSPQTADAMIEAEAFNRGVASVATHPEAQILHRLFECRGRTLSGDLPASAAAAYLSGLLIASDVHGALRALSGTFVPSTVMLVGTPQLMHLYASACATLGLHTDQVDGAAAVLAGLTQIYRRLS